MISAKSLVKKKFKWVDTVINLKGVCQTPGLCLGDHWEDLERLHVVIGSRILSSTEEKSYGLALYDLVDEKKGDFRLLDEHAITESLLDRLNRIGINVNMLEQEGSIMMGSFWPSINEILSGNLYYRSGLFVPTKSEVFFSIYDTNNPSLSKRVIKGRIDSSKQKWHNLNDQLDGKFFKGMFNFGPKNRSFGLTMDNQVLEFIWTQNDDQLIKFLPIGSIRELLNCYGNSTILEQDRSTLTPSVHSMITTTMRTTITTMITKLEPTQAKHFETLRPKIRDKFRDNDEKMNEKNEENNEKDEVPEDEHNFNDIEHQGDDPNNSHLQSPHHSLLPSSIAPNLAKVSARGTFYPQDDGLMWTFTILAAVLVILTVMILIPFLIIRHRSRNNRMYLNKQTNGKKVVKENGLNKSNCPEEVQLMNSFQLEK